ncbi:eLRR (extracellular Leucine-Rich Repeat) ONly [Caenorhabditis elegans]|uniref:ELRR (Extracellular Leucine-Rich Repeat) ONly n=1 Tax=Caenorhabditis elegans TaxID=6239 RepID=O01764_CAEEL|nr:eLRR (extracellular Leucine-Rich Repeat) ONly [Caenorhabditis elegans]CCD70769.1 eLRR (extracellular Leucine-Rich Repeat) ONly [Caenorhabditis elegans]|eukprot:NP_491851.3 eLRR (extracellular Leucine-Rich Repeat) ONly [Caenorhabditis elegans]
MWELSLAIFGLFGLARSCDPLHAQAHGINLVCCSLNHSLTPSCEFSSLCQETCSCFLTITRDLDCKLELLGSANEPYKWLDHKPNSLPMICRQPNLPNPDAPYTIVIENSNESLTHSFLLGSCSKTVTSLTFQHYHKLYDSIDFGECFPRLASFQVVLLQRTKANFHGSLRNLKNLKVLSLVNVDFDFWLQPSPFINTITYIHIENSSITELPKWLSTSKSLSTVYLKGTSISSLTPVAQLPAVKSLKLSHNLIENLHRLLFVSPFLIHVDLSYNQITSFASHTFSKCIDLRVLDLTGNPIKMLPYKPFAKNIKLKWLKLSRTNITTLTPDHFYGLNALKTLSLSRMPIQSISPYSFVPLKSLRYLDMDSCNLTKIPQAVTANCHLARLNVANNMLHRSSSMPPEVMAMLSGLSQLRIEGNPLTEFPASFLLISRENFRLLRQLLHSTMTLPVWLREPCTPYYWSMHLANRTNNLKSFVNQYSEMRMLKSGLGYCKEQYDWMLEQMEVYRELEKNSGCYSLRRLRSSLSSKPVPKISKNSTNSLILSIPHDLSSPAFHIPILLLISLCANFLLLFSILMCSIMACRMEKGVDSV